MQVGDLVHWNNKDMGLVIDIDPLKEGSLHEYDKINEIVVLRSDGCMWHTSPIGWEVINENRRSS
jgi:hypothetical protein